MYKFILPRKEHRKVNKNVNTGGPELKRQDTTWRLVCDGFKEMNYITNRINII